MSFFFQAVDILNPFVIHDGFNPSQNSFQWDFANLMACSHRTLIIQLKSIERFTMGFPGSHTPKSHHCSSVGSISHFCIHFLRRGFDTYHDVNISRIRIEFGPTLGQNCQSLWTITNFQMHNEDLTDRNGNWGTYIDT